MLTSLFSGSVTVYELSVFPQQYHISPSEARWIKDFAQSRQMMYALFAQASQLSLSSSQILRSIDYRVHNMQYIEGWYSISEKLRNIMTNFYLVCNTIAL